MLGKLHEKISEVCPIDGISLSDPILIGFAVGATEAQQEAAIAIVDAWNFENPKLNNVLGTLSDIRWQKESSGITVGNQPVSTLREEMAIWQGMLLDMTLRPGATTSFEYKPRGGSNVTLTAQQVQRIYACFAWYVAVCFGTERYLASQIGTLTNEQIIALAESDSTWPQREFTWEAPS
jgi:hypothetical protein